MDNYHDFNFGYNSPIKKIAKHCAYTGEEFTKRNRATFEHIKPHSLGGSNTINNMLATTAKSNNERGNMPFDKWLQLHPEAKSNIQNYLNEMRGIKVGNQDYVESVKPTLNREAKGVISFNGNVGTRLNYLA